MLVDILSMEVWLQGSAEVINQMHFWKSGQEPEFGGRSFHGWVKNSLVPPYTETDLMHDDSFTWTDCLFLLLNLQEYLPWCSLICKKK